MSNAPLAGNRLGIATLIAGSTALWSGITLLVMAIL